MRRSYCPKNPVCSQKNLVRPYKEPFMSAKEDNNGQHCCLVCDCPTFQMREFLVGFWSYHDTDDFFLDRDVSQKDEALFKGHALSNVLYGHASAIRSNISQGSITSSPPTSISNLVCVGVCMIMCTRALCCVKERSHPLAHPPHRCTHSYIYVT